MILPVPQDVRQWQRFPLTWTLLLLNVLIFVMIFSGRPDTYGEQKILTNDNVEVTGRLYFQYLQNVSPQILFSKPGWMHEMQATNSDQMETLGAYALRDGDFLAAAETMKFFGDAVRIQQWQKDLREFRRYYYDQSVFNFGLHSFGGNPLAWLTYQFSHSGWVHLLSNMLFLVIMGIAVEAIAGSAALLAVYVIGGCFGGLGFLLLNANGAVPMVGASASVSALLAFYCVVEVRKRIRYLFFISPMQGQNGSIYLPTLLIFPLFLLVDFGSLLSTPDGFASGVAYSAHIGGTLFGLSAGLAYRLWPRAVRISHN